MQTAFQPNAFQNDAFQISSAVGSSVGSQGKKKRTWAVKNSDHYLYFDTVAEAADALEARARRSETIEPPRIEYLGQDIAAHEINGVPALDIVLKRDAERAMALEAYFEQRIAERMAAFEALMRQRQQQEGELLLLMMMS